MSTGTVDDLDVGEDLADGLGSPDVDPEAPYGRRDDGTPYLKSPEERERLKAQLAAGKERAKAEGRSGRPKVTRPRTAGRRGPSRPPAPKVSPLKMNALGLVQLPAMALGVASRWVPVLALDSLALTMHAEPLADAVVAVAESPGGARWASVLERTAQVGPYGGLLLAVIPLAAQLAANHGLIPPNAEMGVMSPDQLYAAHGMTPPPESVDATTADSRPTG